MFGKNFLAFCVLLSATSCSAIDAVTSKSRTLQPWLVGLSAVVGFLLIVFLILIGKKLLSIKREKDEKRCYDKKLADLDANETNL